MGFAHLLRFFCDVPPSVLVAWTLRQNVDRLVQVVLVVGHAAPCPERAPGGAVQVLHLKVGPRRCRRPRLRTHVHHLDVAERGRRADVARNADWWRLAGNHERLVPGKYLIFQIFYYPLLVEVF